MISLEDCLGLCGLSEEEVLAIAEHEHIPEIAAAALGRYLLEQSHGAERIRDMIVDDIKTAALHGNAEHAKELVMALRHFLTEHPEARAR
jgi:DNA repair protein RadC